MISHHQTLSPHPTAEGQPSMPFFREEQLAALAHGRVFPPPPAPGPARRRRARPGAFLAGTGRPRRPCASSAANAAVAAAAADATTRPSVQACCIHVVVFSKRILQIAAKKKGEEKKKRKIAAKFCQHFGKKEKKDAGAPGRLPRGQRAEGPGGGPTAAGDRPYVT